MISICIPTWNEEKSIARCIRAVLRQISLEDEIVVVASGCIDNTISEIKSLCKTDKRIRLIVEKERNGKASAINLAIKAAKGEIIIQLDGDVFIDPGAVSSLFKHFEDQKVGAVSGNPVPIIPEDNLFSEWTKMSYRKASELREQQSMAGTFSHLCGYLLAFRKSAITEVPFAKGAVDAVMGKIIKENGYKLVYEPNAKVHVKAPTNVHDFLAQKARVRAGFLLMPSGGPRTIGREVLWFPRELLRVPVSKWPKFIISGFVYLWSWGRGWWYAKTNKSLNQIWQTPISTK